MICQVLLRLYGVRRISNTMEEPFLPFQLLVIEWVVMDDMVTMVFLLQVVEQADNLLTVLIFEGMLYN